MQKGHGRKVHINEVATRDGFQMEDRFIPTDLKIGFINQLSQLGYRKIEVTSFTSAQAIPALSDSEAVMQQIERRPGIIYTALVPNMRGAERALESRIEEFNVVMSTSETHNLANLRMTREQSFAQLSAVIRLAQSVSVPVNVSLSCVFGCPMEGEIPQETIVHWIGRFADLGVRGITLCDTTGMAYPTQVSALADMLLIAFPRLSFTAHFHNTRAMGLVNVIAAIESGIDRLDMSLGGIGGCPYAPGASGNVATEDVVHMLECMGYDTGMDLDGLIKQAQYMETLLGHSVPSQVVRAGHRLTQHATPSDFDRIVERAQQRALDAARSSVP